MIKFTIPGVPKAKARPRMSTKTGRAYTPQDTLNYEAWVKQCYVMAVQEQQQQTKFNLKLDGQLSAVVTAYYPIPKSTSKKNRQAMLGGTIRPQVKPDTDNIAKIILDSLNQIAYYDDKQIVELVVLKYYDEEPRVEVTLSKVGD